MRLCPKKLGAYAIEKRRNPLEFHKASAPNLPEPHKVSAPEPSGTSQGICPGTLRNLTTHLDLGPPEPHQVAAPETSGTSPGTCTKTF